MSGDAVTWLGHSTVAVRVDDTLVLTDPVLRGRLAHLRRSRPPERTALGGLAAVLVSHLHYDHLDLPSLELLDRSLPVVVPRGAGGLLRRRGFRDVREVEEGDRVELDGVGLLATHAAHTAARRIGTHRTAALGYVVLGTHTVYFAGDTDLFDDMARLAPLDVALLPVAGWGPRLPPGHLDPARAAEALLLLRPRLAIPIHWGTFAPWRAPAGDDTPAAAFAAAAAATAPEVEVRILRPGERYALV